MKSNYPVSRKADIVVQELDSEVLIYDLKTNKAVCLNETSAMIWQMCDGNKSLTEISRELSDKLKSPADEGLVWLALEQLKKEKLVESEISVPAAFAGMSRREVIKKVGLGSMIALPLISSLIAPVAINAASAAIACNTGTTCTCTLNHMTNGPGANCNPNAANAPQCTVFTSGGMSCVCIANDNGNNTSPGTCALV